MTGWIMRWRYRRQRNFDLMVVWPAIRDLPGELIEAKERFAEHVFHEKAWRKVKTSTIRSIINGLE
jgi:hypothetical protein